jgi:hypothetical protein
MIRYGCLGCSITITLVLLVTTYIYAFHPYSHKTTCNLLSVVTKEEEVRTFNGGGIIITYYLKLHCTIQDIQVNITLEDKPFTTNDYTIGESFTVYYNNDNCPSDPCNYRLNEKKAKLSNEIFIVILWIGLGVELILLLKILLGDNAFKCNNKNNNHIKLKEVN